jgi:general secretion pathway protein G
MRPNSGFTLVEVMIMILVLSALAVASIVTVSGDLDQARQQQTIQKMKEIRDAIYGSDVGRAVRSQFGYVGDLGAAPNLAPPMPFSGLWTQPATAQAWTVSTSPAVRIGSGWNGPYLKSFFSNGDDTYSKDAWGRDFEYLAPTQAADGYLRSKGADGQPSGTGSAADITMNLPSSQAYATVFVVVQNSGVACDTHASATLWFPDGNGILVNTTVSITMGANGLFQFPAKVPFGKRSIEFTFTTPDPDLTSGPYEITIDRPNTLIVLGTAAKPIVVSCP